MSDELPILPTNPTTAAEWQEAVDIARAALHVAYAEQGGSASGKHEAYIERAFDLIERGNSLGIEPRDEDYEEG